MIIEADNIKGTGFYQSIKKTRKEKEASGMETDEAELAAWRDRHDLLRCHLDKNEDEINQLLSMNADQNV